MNKLSRSEKMWLIFFAVVFISLVGSCMYETVTKHDPIGPRPTRQQESQP
jgi:cell division protein FtsL